ncbi:hypothetical protein SAMN05519104_7670 [Rhizobiales bacterium GAS188]|nr:hypothetical protein SAMN05519104_7670 [Rhizobiales bacterium GAS188]
MAATAVAVRVMEAMVQFALLYSECKPVAAGALHGPE